MAEKGRQYVAIDAKSFYASVECVERRQGFHQLLFCISSQIILVALSAIENLCFVRAQFTWRFRSVIGYHKLLRIGHCQLAFLELL